MRENKWARKLVSDRCAKINTCEINQCPIREINSVQKLVQLGYHNLNKAKCVQKYNLSANWRKITEKRYAINFC